MRASLFFVAVTLGCAPGFARPAAGVSALDLELPSADGKMPQYPGSVRMDALAAVAAAGAAIPWPAAAGEALDRNPSLREARLAVAQARQQVRIADAGFLPTITANAGVNRGHGQQIVNGGLINTSSGSYQGDLVGSWNLFNGFQTLATRDVDLAALRGSQASYDQASSALYLSLGEAFDQVLYDQADLGLLRALVGRYHSDTLYQAQEFKDGLTALWTYEKAQADEAGQVWAYNQEQYALLSDRGALAVLLGRPVDLAGGLAAAGSITVAAPPQDCRADMARMLASNPTLRYFEALAGQADATVWQAESTRYPSIGLNGSTGTTGLETWGPRNKQWQASLTMSYELFAGGAPEAAITQADEASRQARVAVQDQRHQLQAAFVKAWIGYISSALRLPSTDMAVRAGKDRFATVGALYQAGREEFLDYEQAESIYSGAQTQQLQALLAAAEAQVSYRNALGLTLERAALSPAP